MRHGILLDKMGERSKALSLRLKEAEDYFVNVKLAHEVGEMDDEAYRLSRDALHDLVNRLQTEQKDIKLAQETLQQTRISLENAEPSQKPPQVEPQAISPEAPIVLRLKEAEE